MQVNDIHENMFLAKKKEWVNLICVQKQKSYFSVTSANSLYCWPKHVFMDIIFYTFFMPFMHILSIPVAKKNESQIILAILTSLFIFPIIQTFVWLSNTNLKYLCFILPFLQKLKSQQVSEQTAGWPWPTQPTELQKKSQFYNG